MKIILINGKKRSGKNYFAERLKKELEKYGKSVECLSFSKPLKEIISIIFEINAEELERYKNEPKIYTVSIKKNDEEIKTTNFRKILQLFGTEGAKLYFGEDVWVKILIKTIQEKYKNINFIIIPDFRFLCENIGDVTIKIINKDVEEIDDHRSENELNNFKFDYYVDNTGYRNIDGVVSLIAKELIKLPEKE